MLNQSGTNEKDLKYHFSLKHSFFGFNIFLLIRSYEKKRKIRPLNLRKCFQFRPTFKEMEKPLSINFTTKYKYINR